MLNKLGFGFLRLPKKDGELDWQTICSMVDEFMDGGGVFFDTCYTYLDGLSEAAIRKCVVERKPRHSFQLCEKLPGYLFKSYGDCRKFFDEELSRCGVEWFDNLMLHWLNDENYAIAEKYDEFRFLREKKAEGKAERIGFSYHGDAALLDRILSAHPEVDVVLMQLNYLDWESEGIQSRKCYETCRQVCDSHGTGEGRHVGEAPGRCGSKTSHPSPGLEPIRLGTAVRAVPARGGNLPQRHGYCGAGTRQHPAL